MAGDTASRSENGSFEMARVWYKKSDSKDHGGACELAGGLTHALWDHKKGPENLEKLQLK